MLRLARTAALVATLALPTAALADDAPTASGTVTNIHANRKFGVGFGSGVWASGISAKLFLHDRFAVQAVAGWGWGWGGYNLGADAMLQMPQIWGNGDFGLNWEAGGGAFVAAWGGIGVNAVAGLSLQYKPVPLEFTADIRPTLLIGDFGSYWGRSSGPFDINFGAAARYYF